MIQIIKLIIFDVLTLVQIILVTCNFIESFSNMNKLLIE